MGTLTASMLLPSKFKSSPSLYDHHDHHSLSFSRFSRSPPNKRSQSLYPMMRLFGPAIFEASKLKVLFLGVDEEKHPSKLPRTYTLTHSDITSKLTLAISQTINNSQLQGWYNKLQRDEVVAEWKKVKGMMSLHVHCHISGGHFLLDLFARLRNYIFCKELPVVLRAFVHGDESLFNNHPELEEASVWVYFHSNIPEFNKVECWGPLRDAVAPTANNKGTTTSLVMKNQPEGVGEGGGETDEEYTSTNTSLIPEEPCKEPCMCCFPQTSSIPWIHSLQTEQQQENVAVQVQGLELE